MIKTVATFPASFELLRPKINSPFTKAAVSKVTVQEFVPVLVFGASVQPACTAACRRPHRSQERTNVASLRAVPLDGEAVSKPEGDADSGQAACD